MRSDILTNSTDTRRFYLVLGCLIVVAWVLLIALQRSSYGELLDHEAIGHDHAISHAPEQHHLAEFLGSESIDQGNLPPGGRLAFFLVGWFLMLVAMMLPGSLPVLNIHVHPIRQRIEGTYLVGLIILGYLFPWILFGLMVYLGDSFVHRMFDPAAPLATFSGLISPAILLVAGLYQFTPVKRRYMARCRLSKDQFSSVSLEKTSGVEACKHGLWLGVFCVGSCWSLMLLMFALGHNRLDWMLVLGLIMAAERLAPWGYRLSWLVGFVLVVWATFFALATR